MAELAASAVETLFTWLEGSTGSTNRRARAAKVALTLTGQGTVTNFISAEVLGFDRIDEASAFVQDDDTDILVAVPSDDGSMLLLKASGTNAPADFTGTFTGVVRGASATAQDNFGT